MKKFALIVAIILAVLIGAAIIIPIAFKGPLLEKVKTTINKNVNAKVEFSDFSLSLFKSFPNVQVELDNLTVTGKDQFQDDTLANVGSIATAISLGDLFKQKGLKISSLTINNPNIFLLSTEDGLTNWDLAMPEDSVPQSNADKGGKSMAIDLQDIDIQNLNLTYKDEASNVLVKLLHSNIQSSGQAEGTVTNFNIDGKVGEFVLNYDSTEYIANTVLKVNSQLSVDYDKMNFILGETSLHLNDLPLAISGRFEMPSDSMYFDLQFKQPQSDFATLLAMVPKSYQSYLEKFKTSGKAGFEGHVKGWYYEDNYPEINTHLFVKNASMQYAGSPEKVEQISLESTVNKPQGDMDLMVVKVSQGHAQIRNNPVDMKLTLTHPATDPLFDASFKGKIDFTQLNQVFPMDSVELRGVMDGQLAVRGKMSAIEQQDYQQVSSNGTFKFNNFKIKTPQITRPVEINSGTVKINNTAIDLSAFKAKTGQSDFELNGKLSNYLPYFLLDKTLKGNFNLQSNYLNFNELASLMAEPDTTAATTTQDSVIAFQVPGNLDLLFQSNVNRATFDQMEIKNIVGVIQVKDHMLQLQQLNMEMLQGQLTMNGNYTSNKANRPTFDFSMDINSFKIPAAYQSFGMMQRYMPIAARSQGNISSKINFKGQFNEKLDIIASSLDGSGLFNTQNLQIVNSPTFDQIKNFIKKEKLKNVKVDDFTAHFSIDHGNVAIKPFQTKIADQDVAIHGNVSVAQKLDLAMDFRVNKDDLSGDIKNGLGFLPGSENIQKLDVSVLVKGDLKKPDVSLDLSKARKQIENEVKKSTQKQVEKSVKKLGNELKKLFN
ncbi:MAG TPA: AsmA-like C-terminal region-containing protein [Sunxiuqinia sp.]|nr:AsmA-like C-terminal region-containing protein [Sunxiuqinia sp.]